MVFADPLRPSPLPARLEKSEITPLRSIEPTATTRPSVPAAPAILAGSVGEMPVAGSVMSGSSSFGAAGAASLPADTTTRTPAAVARRIAFSSDGSVSGSPPRERLMIRAPFEMAASMARARSASRNLHPPSSPVSWQLPGRSARMARMSASNEMPWPAISFLLAAMTPVTSVP